MNRRSTLIRAMGNRSYTDNKALSYASTLSDVLDLFSKVGALRNWPEYEIRNLLEAAWREDPNLTMRTIFYGRDIRGKGTGERRFFHVALNWLGLFHPGVAAEVVELVPEYGRWDDLYALVGTPAESYGMQHLADQMQYDYNLLRRDGAEARITLAGKWAKSINTSSKESVKLARLTMRYLRLNPDLPADQREYRRMTSALREQAKVVERLMSAARPDGWTGEMRPYRWNEIDFNHVPGKAMVRYGRNRVRHGKQVVPGAFRRHQGERYEEYLSSVKRGEAKINTAALTPYDLIRHYVEGVREDYGRRTYTFSGVQMDAAIEAAWANLRDVMESLRGAVRLLPMLDTSGSMFRFNRAPIINGLGLTVYTAQNNTGPFQDAWLNFSEKPQMQVLEGETLLDKLKSINLNWDGFWGNNTNIQAAFRLILETAQAYNLPEEEMPNALVIISDMQFDQANGRNTITNYAAIEAQYNAAGYEMPLIIFWNVEAYQDQPVVANQPGAVLVSGSSPTIMSALMTGDLEQIREVTPYEKMLEVLNSERYAQINIG